ncbi:alpha/beta hydrolase family protein [Adhaeribacter swui]|uniref:hypothetical protein n=1 Tax=Adhaeribacter swui TaxID=2086471 RepID=UPI001E5A72EA|nr:hypothetical protein [Adhaeribacter swui]
MNTNPNTQPKKTNIPFIDKGLRLLSIFTIFGLVLSLSACQDDDESNTGIDPSKPKPEWGPTIKPEMQAVIEALDSLSKGVPLNTLTPQQARLAPTATDAVMAVMKNNNIAMPPSLVDTMGYSVPVTGGSIHVRSYKPKNATSALPGIVYYHGGVG